MIILRKCYVCKKRKNIKYFYNNKTQPLGKSYECRDCANSGRFGGNREAALKRDGYKCVKCGITREEHKKKFNKDITIDHIDGRGVGKKAKDKNNSLDNLQTLCSRCHGMKDTQTRILTFTDASEIREIDNFGFSPKAIAEAYGTTKDNIYKIRAFKTFKTENLITGS